LCIIAADNPIEIHDSDSEAENAIETQDEYDYEDSDNHDSDHNGHDRLNTNLELLNIIINM